MLEYLIFLDRSGLPITPATGSAGVQGDTGHSQSRMVANLYAHTHNEDRRRLAQKVEEDFFQKRPSETKKAAANETDLAYRLLQENPDIAKLIIATLQNQGA